MKEDIVNNLRAKVKEVEAHVSRPACAWPRRRFAAPSTEPSQTIADAYERAQPGQPIVVVHDPRRCGSAPVEETHIRKVQTDKPSRSRLMRIRTRRLTAK